jgi:hypothetical protein
MKHATRDDVPFVYNTIDEVCKNYLTPEEYEHFNSSEYFDSQPRRPFTLKPRQAVWFNGNAYGGDAKPFRAEKSFIMADGMSAEVEEHNGELILTLNVPESAVRAENEAVTTQNLGAPVFSEERYENPDGSDVDFTLDLVGNRRNGEVIPGPFAQLEAGVNRIAIWKR